MAKIVRKDSKKGLVLSSTEWRRIKNILRANEDGEKSKDPAKEELVEQGEQNIAPDDSKHELRKEKMRKDRLRREKLEEARKAIFRTIPETREDEMKAKEIEIFRTNQMLAKEQQRTRKKGLAAGSNVDEIKDTWKWEGEDWKKNGRKLSHQYRRELENQLEERRKLKEMDARRSQEEDVQMHQLLARANDKQAEIERNNARMKKEKNREALIEAIIMSSQNKDRCMLIEMLNTTRASIQQVTMKNYDKLKRSRTRNR